MYISRRHIVCCLGMLWYVGCGFAMWYAERLLFALVECLVLSCLILSCVVCYAVVWCGFWPDQAVVVIEPTCLVVSNCSL
jgi:hypothetical protein